MDDHCPECGNEIYMPYTYCNACGWEKKEEDEEKVEKKKKGGKSTSKKKSKMEAKKGSKKKEKTEEMPVKPLKITCKCGGVIRIKSKKRPLKFKCPDCGKRGELKGPEPVISKTKEKPKKSKSKSKSYSQESEDEEFGEFDEFDEFEEDEVEEAKKVKPEKRPKSDFERKERPKPRPKPRPKARPRARPRERPRERSREGLRERPKEKPGERRSERSKERPVSTAKKPRRKKPKFEPPESAYVVKPVKGKCSSCNSRNLRFFDDGSGRCTNCGKEFSWGGGSSRIQKKEYFCQRCRKPLEYIEEYKQWYCYNCNEYA
jgi:predicted RNA-binding Zn-ribbon protein involved in translation (DUF1610 family)